jgi:hypothetical protein
LNLTKGSSLSTPARSVSLYTARALDPEIEFLKHLFNNRIEFAYTGEVSLSLLT